MKIKAGDKEFTVKVAADDNSRAIGLSTTEKLPKKEGLVLKFEEAYDVPITMADMKYPLDIIFSNGGKIGKIVTAQPGDEVMAGIPSDLILEINAGEADGIKVGDVLEMIGEKKPDGTVEMADGGLAPKGERFVLDENGKNQMNLLGNERIFSRKATRRIFELANKKEFKKLGKFLIDEVRRQDNRPAEYAAN